MILTSLWTFLQRRRTALWALLLMSLVYFFSYFQRVAIPGTIFDELQSEFGVSAGAIATLSSLFLYIYGGLQIAVGLAADRWGGARVLLAGGLLLSLGALWFPLAHSFPELYASRILVGLGASSIFISIVKEIDTLFESRHFAPMLCIVLFIGYSGGLFATFPFERMVAWMGWRPSLLITGVLYAAIFLTAAILLKRFAGPRAEPSPKVDLYLKDILGNPHIYPVVFSGAVNFAIYFIWQAVFGKKMLTDVCGFSSAGAASVTFYMMLIGMIFVTASGFLSRLMGNRRKPVMIAGIILTLIALALMTLSLTPHPHPRWMLTGYLMLGIASSASVMFSCTMKELNPERAAGTSVGFGNSACYLAVAVIVNGAGALMDLFRDQAISSSSALVYPPSAYRAILFLCLVLAAISAISVFFIRESRGISIYRPHPPSEPVPAA
ncbi:MAG: MFS transporter [Verrucomicrobia bacterium]|nr:MFS transporter [Verrucomicrobiota bacterium]MCG2679245.1 MFS transporter [Kiritimatiellia bacterium]MBU4248639.1 MFS transporter [Verrucomicrobiota bacterium]MBU4290100.1 MFS transporter [Verrucomicrobiota bacterium]MBU4429798.1 MFS transporter [Verrucomicrobiota bacterium]